MWQSLWMFLDELYYIKGGKKSQMLILKYLIQPLLFAILYLLYINFNYCWHIKAVLHILDLVCAVIYI